MALYHKWDVRNGFAYVLQFFSLIFDGLGCVKQTQDQFSTKSSRHWFILQTVQNVVDCQIDHFQSRFSCGRPDMGRQENIG